MPEDKKDKASSAKNSQDEEGLKTEKELKEKVDEGITVDKEPENKKYGETP